MEKSVAKNELIFAVLLMGPSMVLYSLRFVEPTPLIDRIYAAITLAAVTLAPLLGALYFNRNKSIYLPLLIPLVLAFFKALNFSGAERLVVAGFLIFLVLSALSWALGLLIRYLYAKYFLKTI